MLFIDHEFKGIYQDQRKAWKHGVFLMMKTLKKERKADEIRQGRDEKK